MRGNPLHHAERGPRPPSAVVVLSRANRIPQKPRGVEFASVIPSVARNLLLLNYKSRSLAPLGMTSSRALRYSHRYLQGYRTLGYLTAVSQSVLIVRRRSEFLLKKRGCLGKFRTLLCRSLYLSPVS